MTVFILTVYYRQTFPMPCNTSLEDGTILAISSKCIIFIVYYMEVNRGVARSKNVGWTHMASAEREPITGSGAGQKPGGQAPLKLKTF